MRIIHVNGIWSNRAHIDDHWRAERSSGHIDGLHMPPGLKRMNDITEDSSGCMSSHYIAIQAFSRCRG